MVQVRTGNMMDFGRRGDVRDGIFEQVKMKSIKVARLGRIMAYAGTGLAAVSMTASSIA